MFLCFHGQPLSPTKLYTSIINIFFLNIHYPAFSCTYCWITFLFFISFFFSYIPFTYILGCVPMKYTLISNKQCENIKLQKHQHHNFFFPVETRLDLPSYSIAAIQVFHKPQESMSNTVWFWLGSSSQKIPIRVNLTIISLFNNNPTS